MIEKQSRLWSFQTTLVILLLVCTQMIGLGCNKKQAGRTSTEHAKQANSSKIETTERDSKSPEEIAGSTTEHQPPSIVTAVNAAEMTDIIDWKDPTAENFVQSTT